MSPTPRLLRPTVLLVLLAACRTEKPAPAPPPAAPPPPAPEAPTDTAPPPPTNHAPRIQQLRIEPASPTVQQDITARVEVVDPDGQPLDVRFQWFRNDRQVLHRVEDVLPRGEFAKGDAIRVKVVASDGIDTVERESPTVKVANAPPLFVRDPRNVRDVVGYRVEATDPDGDPVTYRLEGAPRGMSIDPERGLIRYEGSVDEPGGTYTVTVIAEDPDGAAVRWQFPVTVSPGSAAARKATGDAADG